MYFKLVVIDVLYDFNGIDCFIQVDKKPRALLRLLGFKHKLCTFYGNSVLGFWDVNTLCPAPDDVMASYIEFEIKRKLNKEEGA